MSDTAEIHVTVERREDIGKGPAGRLRRDHKVPAVVYGGDMAAYAITADEKEVRDLIRKHGENTIFLLKLAGTEDERPAMIKHLDVHPITGQLQHIDFIRVTRGHALHVKVDVDLVGDSVGVRHGGRLDFVTRELEVEVLPRDMFSKIEVDITDLEIGQHIEVENLVDKLPESAKFLEDLHRVVVVIEAPRVVETGAEDAGEELVIAETAEPELIRKGKDEEEGA